MGARVTRKPEPSDRYGGPAVAEYRKTGEVWREEPAALPEGDPVREAWVKRIRDFSLNDRGTPPVRDWRRERLAPDHDAPFVRREKG